MHVYNVNAPFYQNSEINGPWVRNPSLSQLTGSIWPYTSSTCNKRQTGPNSHLSIITLTQTSRGISYMHLNKVLIKSGVKK